MRVLSELGLVVLEREGPALTVTEAPARTALERSAAFRAYRQRLEDGLTIPDDHDSQRSGLTARPRGAAARPWPAARRAATARASRPMPGRPPSTARRTRTSGRSRSRRPSSTDFEQRLLADLFAIVEEHADEVAEQIDRDRGRAAPSCSPASTTPTSAASPGESFVTHPVGVAKICAGMRLDTATLCAALLHDTVEDTSASLEEVETAFGEEVAGLVDGVTKLTGITFQSRDEAQAENYRKMMVAMATDIRVILIKLADRLHNMRTLGAMPKQKQIDKAKETLEIYAPLAHRLGIHAIKWELEDLAFATLHPRKYQDIKGLVSQQRDERERYVAKAGGYLTKELEALGISGGDLRARQALLLDLLEDDQEGPRVQRDLRPHGHAGHRRLREGLLRRRRRHPLALEAAPRPLQGHGGDAEVQHVPGAAHHGDRARGTAARDPDPHRARCTRRPSTASPRTGATRRTRARAAATRPTPSSTG